MSMCMTAADAICNDACMRIVVLPSCHFYGPAFTCLTAHAQFPSALRRPLCARLITAYVQYVGPLMCAGSVPYHLCVLCMAPVMQCAFL